MSDNFIISVFNDEEVLIEEFGHDPGQKRDELFQTHHCIELLLEIVHLTRLHALRIEVDIKIFPDSPYDQQVIVTRLHKLKNKITSVDLFQFTKREKQVLIYLLNGMTTKAIADALFISFETARTHRKNILSKTGATNTSSLNKLFNPLIRNAELFSGYR